MMKRIIIIIVVVITSCSKNIEPHIENPQFIHEALDSLTKTMVNDIFSPPVASRIYAYPFIASYEAILPAYPQYKSLSNQLNGLKSIPKPKPNTKYYFEISAVKAFLEVSKKMVYTKDKLINFEKDFIKNINKTNGSNEDIQRSLEYGIEVANHILNWADKDNYKQTRTFSRPEISNAPGAWQPTPPDYMAGIEPNWNKIRPFVLDSAVQFRPSKPTVFSLDKDSQFFKELMEVYNTGINLNDEQKKIAQFWDCNPYVSHHQGHVMFATKKITPGGHWIGITKIATKQSNFDMGQTIAAYTKVSIGIADAFISCWDEKWNSNLIRPETVIKKYIDENWSPILQTPPFPEYTSGHSVISMAAAIILTDVFNDQFEFDDTSELDYGLPVRSYKSFIDAASEAAISRHYGGIHYMPAINNGMIQGNQVGLYVLSKIKIQK